MAKELVFHKYHGLENNYLVYDINKNQVELDGSVIRKIRSRNFGVDLAGILVGPFMNEGTISMKLYTCLDNNCSANYTGVFSKYLKDAGYVKKDGYILHTAWGDVKIRGNETDGEELCQSKVYCWC